MPYRYVGESEHVGADLVVGWKEDQRSVGRAQLDRADVLEQHVEVLTVVDTGGGMQE